VRTDVFLIVIGSALVHAIWNALIKGGGDRLALIKVFALSHVALSLALLPFFPLPTHEAWPYLVAGAVCSTGYMLLLNQAYQAGDLAFVYPLARGTAPLIVAVVSIAFLGQELGYVGQLGILLIGLSITSLALTRRTTEIRELRPVVFALATGCFTAAYTILDGLGARIAGTAHGYMICSSLTTAILTLGCVQYLRRGPITAISGKSSSAGIASGLMSYGAYWVVIWAFTQAPIPLVSALRETGIVFAVIIGVVFLKERVRVKEWLAIMTTMAGTGILKFTR
jgi:drug/metabolite transporter (DMT)-like permease